MICPKLNGFLGHLNTQLATFNATKYNVGIDFSLGSVHTTTTSIELGFKGVFYNPQQRKPPFPPTDVSLKFHTTTMFCIAISAFTINSAFSVFHNAGVFNINITDNMIPSVSPILLSTLTFGAFIPQISQTYPDLKLKLIVKTVKEPVVKFEPNKVTVQLFSTVTAVQSNNTQTELFDLKGSVGVQVSVKENKLELDLTLEKIDVTLNTQTFEFPSLNLLKISIEDILFPIIKAHLAKGFPLPDLLGDSFGKVHLVNPQVEVLRDYVLVGTDIQFGENTKF